ncbi:MAG TPA: hypothetical protein VHI75_04470 [Casimicrobiaceae bacterium]|nr:hypothetical protein [Casimicrobiaceae bacterium]
MLRAAWTEHAGAEEAELTNWRIENIALGPLPSASAQFVVQHGAGHFTITDESGSVLLELKGVALLSREVEVSAATMDERRPRRAMAPTI